MSLVFLSCPQETSSTPLTGKMCWNKSLRSWFLPWHLRNFPLPACCPRQTMHHQLTWSSAPLLSLLLPTTHRARGPPQPACSRSNRQPDQVGLLAAHLQAARLGCCPCLVEYRSAPAVLYVPGGLLGPFPGLVMHGPVTSALQCVLSDLPYYVPSWLMRDGPTCCFDTTPHNSSSSCSMQLWQRSAGNHLSGRCCLERWLHLSDLLHGHCCQIPSSLSTASITQETWQKHRCARVAYICIRVSLQLHMYMAA